MTDKPKKKRSIAVWAWGITVLVLAGFGIYGAVQPGSDKPNEISTSAIVQMIEDDKVESAKMSDNTRSITVTDQEGQEFTASYPAQYSETLTNLLIERDVETDTVSVILPLELRILDAFLGLLPIILILAFLIWSLKTGFISKIIDKSKGSDFIVETPDVTFDDVAGCDEAVSELQEIVEFIKDGERFTRLGAQSPRGALLCGPPGTGKTLLARAVAGTAGVPFLAVSGSDFMEMFVGVGAKRVGRIFDTIRQRGEGIIFIDEIDVIGAARNSIQDSGGGTQERENTLNKLLVELDGFNARGKIIVLAATNRPDMLDPALVRPGRLDRSINVPLPDRRGREAILKIHARGKPINEAVNFAHLAAETQNMSGAELEQIVNEASMCAARRSADSIDVNDFQDAVHTVIMGRAKTSAYLTERDKELTAWHEAGHAVVAMMLANESDNPEPPIYATLIPRGSAGGFTKTDSSEDNYIYRNQARDRLAMMMGGRQAEIIHCGKDNFTSGASGDYQAATKLAGSMVYRLAMTPDINWALPPEQGLDLSDAEKSAPIRALIEEASQRAAELLQSSEGMRLLKTTAEQLLMHESLNREQLDDIRKGVII